MTDPFLSRATPWSHPLEPSLWSHPSGATPGKLPPLVTPEIESFERPSRSYPSGATSLERPSRTTPLELPHWSDPPGATALELPHWSYPYKAIPRASNSFLAHLAMQCRASVDACPIEKKFWPGLGSRPWVLSPGWSFRLEPQAAWHPLVVRAGWESIPSGALRINPSRPRRPGLAGHRVTSAATRTDD